MSKISGLPLALKLARVAAGLSAQQVAEALGVSQQAVSKWERPNGGAVPSDERLASLARLYNTTTEDFINRAHQLAKQAAPSPAGESSGTLRASPGVLAAFAQSAQPQGADAYAKLAIRFSDRVDHTQRVLQLWQSVLDCTRGMGSALDAYVHSSPPAAELIRAYQEFGARSDVALEYSLRIARLEIVTPEMVERAEAASILNQVLFAVGLLPPERRPILSREQHEQWLAHLGLATKAQHLAGTRISYTPSRTDGAQLLDEDNRLLTFFDGRLLAD
jgi:DNA-binding XRE family transcriptional regulator